MVSGSGSASASHHNMFCSVNRCLFCPNHAVLLKSAVLSCMLQIIAPLSNFLNGGYSKVYNINIML